MLTRKMYYYVKPFIPRSMQIVLRRNIALRKRLSYRDIWPIFEKANQPPNKWTGWPDRKKFALVLTHDVDTAKGQAKCHELIKIEEALGFRSSFNFVPERYSVSSELRLHLTRKRFEVGVHGLYHDGKYFNSRKEFQKRAARINQYLKEWEAVGYRSPSMQYNLDWFHDLNIEYDASTFDTDPFEPQPEGVGTIFPFWVAATRNSQPPTHNQELITRNSELATHNSQLVAHNQKHVTRNPQPATVSRGGYVELPYTLPQDFTLFILMKEKTIDIWKQKLDWIAKNGGMALLNTHPDYMNYHGKKLTSEEYPAEYYVEFLNTIKSQYEGQYWHVLPKEIARFWAEQYKSVQ